MHSHFRTAIAVAAFACLAGPAFADQSRVAYNVAAGATSPPILIPIPNSPVAVVCTQTVGGDVGVGQASINRSTTDGALIYDGYSVSSTTISGGFSASPGTHITYCDFSNQVDLQVNSAYQIQIKNTSSGTRTGVIMFVY